MYQPVEGKMTEFPFVEKIRCEWGFHQDLENRVTKRLSSYALQAITVCQPDSEFTLQELFFFPSLLHDLFSATLASVNIFCMHACIFPTLFSHWSYRHILLHSIVRALCKYFSVRLANLVLFFSIPPLMIIAAYLHTSGLKSLHGRTRRG